MLNHRDNVTLRRWLLIFGVLTLVVLGTAAFLLYPFFAGPEYFGSDHLKEYLLTALGHNLGRTIDVEDVELTLFPKLRLDLTNVTIYETDPSLVFLQAKHAQIVLRVIPLLWREVVGKRFFVEDPLIHIRRSPEGEWNFSTLAPWGRSAEPQNGHPFSRLFLMREVTVMDGQVLLVDDYRPDGPRTLHVESFELAFLADGGKRRATVHMSGIIPYPFADSSLTVTGTIHQISSQLRMSSPASKDIPPIFQFDGSIEAHRIDIPIVVDFFGPRPVPDHVRGQADLTGHIRVVPGVVGYDVVLTDMVSQVNHVALHGHASLSGLLTAQPTFALTFSTSRVQVNQLLEVFPAQWIHPELPIIMAERQITGNLEVVTATLTGVIQPEPRLSLTGELRIDEGYALVDQKQTPVSHVSSTVLLEPGRIKVVELSGQYGTMQVGGGKVLVSFKEEGSWLDVELDGHMKASDLLAEVDPGTAFKSAHLSKVWKGLRDIEGICRVIYRLSGPLAEPDRIQVTNAEFEPMGISFRSPYLSQPVTGVSGHLVVSHDGVQLDSFSGWLGDIQFGLEGDVEGTTKKVFKDLTITARAKAANLLELLPLGALRPSHLQGAIASVITLSGPLHTPTFKGQFNLDDTTFPLPGHIRKPRGQPATLEFDGAVAQGEVPYVHRVELILPQLRLTGRGSIRLDKRFRINAAIGVGPLSVTSLPPWMRPKDLERGKMEISLDVRGKGTDWTRWDLTGWVALTNGVFSKDGLEGSVRQINLRVKLVPKGAELKHLAFRIFDSDVRITGMIRNWQTRPNMTLTSESSHFDLELLFPQDTRSPVRDMLEELAATSVVTLHASMERGSYKLLALTDVSGRVNMTHSILDIDRIAGKSSLGRVAGRVVVHLPQGKPASTEVSVRLTGLPYQDVHGLISQQESLIAGDLYLTGSIRGDGNHPNGVSSSLNGKLDIRVERGRIFKNDSRALWKILSLLNVPGLLQGKIDLAQDGLPFDRITATLFFHEGTINSQDLVVDSPVIKMTIAGTYDIPRDHLDYVMAVSPFGPYTSLLKSIPVFGQLMKGDGKGIATALFEVKGPLENPKVETLPIRSLATGLAGLAKFAVDVLVNLVTLPATVLSPSEDNGLESSSP